MARVVQVISSVAGSGAERCALDLASRLRVEVRTLVPSEGWLTDALRARGVPVEIVPRGTVSLGLRLAAAHRRGEFDLVHAHLTRGLNSAFVARRLAGVPTIATAHIMKHAPVYRSLTRRGAVVVAVSEFLAEALRAQKATEVVTIRNGTDFTGPDREPEPFLVGVVGRLHLWKGQDCLVRALGMLRAEFPQVRARLVGRADSAFAPVLARAIEESGMKGRVETPGATDDVAGELDRMAVVAMPSEMETFGIAAIEAVARARPVVAARVGALPEVVQDGVTGLVVGREPGEIAAALHPLLENPELARRMGEAGRLRVQERFTLDRTVAAYAELYARALN